MKKKELTWKDARHIARLTKEEVERAKELGLTPRAIVHNIPSKKEPWKDSPSTWIRRIYEKRFK